MFIGKEKARELVLKKYPQFRVGEFTFRDGKSTKSGERKELKKWARKRVFIKIRNKTLHPKPCDKCGKTKVEAHHKDYSKPLEIQWLCKEHHQEAHYGKRIYL